MPNVIKGAMAVGTPVIASRIAGIPELLGGGRHGILVSPKDVGALAHEMEKLLGDRSLWRHCSKAERRYAEEKFDL